MKTVLKAILIFGSILWIISCKETLANNRNNTSLKSNTRAIDHNFKYSKFFGTLLLEKDIVSIFPNAQNFKIKNNTESNLVCEITFINNRNFAGITISAQNSNHKKEAKLFLKRQLKSHVKYIEITNLGDEAYLFPENTMSSIIVLKNNVSYRLQLNSVSKNNSQNTLELMRIIIEKLN